MDFAVLTHHIVNYQKRKNRTCCRVDFAVLTHYIVNIKSEKDRTCCRLDFAFLAHNIVIIKSEKKLTSSATLARELRKLWNVRVIVIPIVIGAFITLSNGLERELKELEIGGWNKTIQTTALLRLARILRRVQETRGDLLPLGLQWNTIS